MKKRIREEIDSSGVSRFYVEYKILCFWITWADTFYDSIEEVKRHINFDYKSDVKYHYLD